MEPHGVAGSGGWYPKSSVQRRALVPAANAFVFASDEWPPPHRVQRLLAWQSPWDGTPPSAARWRCWKAPRKQAELLGISAPPFAGCSRLGAAIPTAAFALGPGK